jgi:hypothetical protein
MEAGLSAAGELVEAGGTVAVMVEGGGMEFLILGPLEVRNGEATVRLGAAKQRALRGVLRLDATRRCPRLVSATLVA